MGRNKRGVYVDRVSIYEIWDGNEVVEKRRRSRVVACESRGKM